MATVTDRFQVIFSAATGPLTRAISRVQRSLRTVQDAAKRAGKALAAIGAAGAVAFAGAAALATRRVQELVRVADGLGTTVETVQNLGAAGAIAGVELDDLQDVLATLQERIGEARIDGKGTAFDAFQVLRLEAEALARLQPEKALERVLDSLSRLDQSKSTFIGRELFGDVIDRLASLRQDPGLLSRETARRDRLGLNLDAQGAANVNQVGQEVTRVLQTVRDLFTQTLANPEFASGVTALREALDRMIESMGGASAIAQRVADGFASIGRLADVLGLTGGPSDENLVRGRQARARRARSDQFFAGADPRFSGSLTRADIAKGVEAGVRAAGIAARAQ